MPLGSPSFLSLLLSSAIKKKNVLFLFTPKGLLSFKLSVFGLIFLSSFGLVRLDVSAELPPGLGLTEVKVRVLNVDLSPHLCSR